MLTVDKLGISETLPVGSIPWPETFPESSSTPSSARISIPALSARLRPYAASLNEMPYILKKAQGVFSLSDYLSESKSYDVIFSRNPCLYRDVSVYMRLVFDSGNTGAENVPNPLSKISSPVKPP